MKVNALSIEKHQLESKSEQDDLIVVEEPLQIQNLVWRTVGIARIS